MSSVAWQRWARLESFQNGWHKYI